MGYMKQDGIAAHLHDYIISGRSTMLDLGCGWGTLARYASTQYGASVTGITLGRNQTAWGNSNLQKRWHIAPLPEPQILSRLGEKEKWT
jgi:cyclopropane fatty-acyl-phospholipid synthase-like methyltransferase